MYSDGGIDISRDGEYILTCIPLSDLHTLPPMPPPNRNSSTGRNCIISNDSDHIQVDEQHIIHCNNTAPSLNSAAFFTPANHTIGSDFTTKTTTRAFPRNSEGPCLSFPTFHSESLVPSSSVPPISLSNEYQRSKRHGMAGLRACSRDYLSLGSGGPTQRIALPVLPYEEMPMNSQRGADAYIHTDSFILLLATSHEYLFDTFITCETIIMMRTHLKHTHTYVHTLFLTSSFF